MIHLIGIDPLPDGGGNYHYNDAQLKWFFPQEIQGRIKSDIYAGKRIDYRKGDGTPFLSFPLDSNLTKMEFRKKWADTIELMEDGINKSGHSRFSVYFQFPTDERGIYFINIWKD